MLYIQRRVICEFNKGEWKWVKKHIQSIPARPSQKNTNKPKKQKQKKTVFW